MRRYNVAVATGIHTHSPLLHLLFIIYSVVLSRPFPQSLHFIRPSKVRHLRCSQFGSKHANKANLSALLNGTRRHTSLPQLPKCATLRKTTISTCLALTQVCTFAAPQPMAVVSTLAPQGLMNDTLLYRKAARYAQVEQVPPMDHNHQPRRPQPTLELAGFGWHTAAPPLRPGPTFWSSA